MSQSQPHMHWNIHTDFLPSLPVLRHFLADHGWLYMGDELGHAKYSRTGNFVTLPLDPGAGDYEVLLRTALLQISPGQQWKVWVELPPELGAG